MSRSPSSAIPLTTQRSPPPLQPAAPAMSLRKQLARQGLSPHRRIRHGDRRLSGRSGRRPTAPARLTAPSLLATHLHLDLYQLQLNRYGENPHQQGGLYGYVGEQPAFDGAAWQGDELQQLARSGRRLACRTGFSRSHGGHHQAWQPVRAGQRRHTG